MKYHFRVDSMNASSASSLDDQNSESPISDQFPGMPGKVAPLQQRAGTEGGFVHSFCGQVSVGVLHELSAALAAVEVGRGRAKSLRSIQLFNQTRRKSQMMKHTVAGRGGSYVVEPDLEV